jgi:hypothetical protein
LAAYARERIVVHRLRRRRGTPSGNHPTQIDNLIALRRRLRDRFAGKVRMRPAPVSSRCGDGRGLILAPLTSRARSSALFTVAPA